MTRVHLDPCDRCGALDWTEPSFRARAAWWLKAGGPWAAAGPRTCRRCGALILGAGYGSRALVADLSRTLPRAIAVPGRALLAPVWLVAALRQNRRRRPTPGIYVAAAVLGAALGVGLQLSAGVPWWFVAAVTIALVWLLFLSSARGSLGNVGRAFLNLAAPASAVKRAERSFEDAFRRSELPLYGLPPGWSGARFLGGYGTDGRNVTSLTLAHGDPYDESGPEVRVEVSRASALPGEYQRRRLFEELENASLGPPPVMDPEAFRRFVHERHRRIRDLPDPLWTPVSLSVDGRPVRFEHLAKGERWVACAPLDDAFLVLHGRRMPVGAVSLVRITDAAPYVDGSRRLRDAHLPTG
jgi:hypothetical protein